MSRRRRTPDWRRLLRRPWLLALALLLGLGDYAHEVYVERPKMAWQGVPQSVRSDLTHLTTHVLRNPGFMLGYSEWKGAPLWVTYRLFRPERGYRVGRRPPFRPDWRTLRHVTPDDYRHTGYDRGHMAPNYAIAKLYGPEAQRATFLMSNITPQRKRLNQKLWQRIEEAAIDHFTRQFESVWVVTGPIWDARPRYLGHTRLDIPDAFYKIFIGLDRSGHPHPLAFIVPQKVRGFEPLSRFVVTVDEVERRTGLDFFWRLPDAQEERLERRVEPYRFRLEAVNRRRPRY
ncbi:DNA/RNA non-specific endonuclease [Sulfurivirga sp.]|uniref:DNA/RNA non-specific endonuclease n=1 Tax=Sulfurivirga sp. TaxID=2614236 RepID=UPI0025F2FCA3|nr:DNA/RNA non-specific endonuclease [Sulfurivirga sp.]